MKQTSTWVIIPSRSLSELPQTDVEEKAVVDFKTELKEMLKQQDADMKEVLRAETSAIKDVLKRTERVLILAVAVFIFGKPVSDSISDGICAAKERRGSRNPSKKD